MVGRRSKELVVGISGEDRGVARPFRKLRKEAEETDRDLRHQGRKTGKGYGDEVGDGAEEGLLAKFAKIGRTVPKALGKSLRVGLKPVAIATATAFSAHFLATLGASLASGVGAIAHGLGATLALLPAMALGGVLAFGALKVAVLGVGEALSVGLEGDLEAFDEALKGLSPSARRFARDVVGLRDELDHLKLIVQERFFRPFAADIGPLADRYLPIIERTLGQVAGAFGRSADKAVTFLASTPTVKALDGALRRVALAVTNVVSGLGNLPRALLPLITVGSTFLPRLTAGFERLTVRFANFMAEAEASGELQHWIQTGLDGLRDLWETTKQLGRIAENIGSSLRTVFDAAGITGNGGYLDAIESATERLEAFLHTSRGGNAMATVFGLVGDVLGGIRDTAERVFGTIVEVVEPLVPDVLDLVAAFLDFKESLIDLGLDILEPALRGIGTVLDVAVLPALTWLFTLLGSENKELLIGIAVAVGTILVPALVAYTIQTTAAAVATNLWLLPIIAVGAAIALLVAGVIWAYQNWGWFRDAFDTVARFLREQLWPALLTGWAIITQQVVPAIQSAWAWFVAYLWPALLTGYAILTQQVIPTVRTAASVIGATLAAAVSWATGMFSSFWAAAQTVWWVLTLIGGTAWSVANTVGGWFSTAAGIAQSAWSSLWSILSDVWSVIDSIIDAAYSAADAIASIPSNIPGAGLVGSAANFLGFDVGGVVPGPVGAPQLAIVHGGETIVPTHNPQAMAGFTNDYGQVVGAGGGDLVVQVGPVVAAVDRLRDTEAAFHKSALRWLQAINIGVWIPAKHLVFTERARLRGTSVDHARRFWESRIPDFADGGIVRATPGGVLARVAEAGDDEAIVPLDGRHDLGGGDTYNHFDFSGAIISSEADAERWVANAWNKAAANRMVNVRGRPL